MSGRWAWPAALATCTALGIGTTLYGLVGARAFPAFGGDSRFFNARPDVDLAERQAYEWAARALPHERVLQANPGANRVFDFGLYGRNRTGVADWQAMLFGASAAAVRQRLETILPAFTQTGTTSAEAKSRAKEAGIDALVVTAADPVWGNAGSWVWAARPIYADPLVRIVDVRDL